MSAAPQLFRSPAASYRAVLVHQLAKPGKEWSELVATELLREPDGPFDALGRMIRSFEDRFLEDYDPRILIRDLRSLRAVDESLRVRLLAALAEAYEARFRPRERRRELQRHAMAFWEVFAKWRAYVSMFGVSRESEPLWQELLWAARTLRDWLDDPDLSTRWIP